MQHAEKSRRPRSSDFPHIAFHESPIGQQAYIRGTRLKVWAVVAAARELGDDPNAVAEHFEIDPELVRESLAYADRFPAEIDAALEFVRSFDHEKLGAGASKERRFKAAGDQIN